MKPNHQLLYANIRKQTTTVMSEKYLSLSFLKSPLTRYTSPRASISSLLAIVNYASLDSADDALRFSLPPTDAQYRLCVQPLFANACDTEPLPVLCIAVCVSFYKTRARVGDEKRDEKLTVVELFICSTPGSTHTLYSFYNI